jgi:hypothetical protein
MTIRVQAFLLCDSVVIDSQTGKTIIQGVFDNIWAQSFPAMHPYCTLYARLELDGASSCEIQIGIRSPSGMYERPLPPQKLIATNSVAQLIMQLQGLPLPEAGRYVFGLIVDGKALTEFPFTASLVAATPQNVTGGPHGQVRH